MTRILTEEETAELCAIRKATPDQLATLAKKCGVNPIIKGDTVYIADSFDTPWDPAVKLCQNHQLLAAVIAQGDCRLLYDDGIQEYFIYRYRYRGANGDGPALAHNTSLSTTVFSAAMELWFPEDE
jgi:hypothetical protein